MFQDILWEFTRLLKKQTNQRTAAEPIQCTDEIEEKYNLDSPPTVSKI